MRTAVLMLGLGLLSLAGAAGAGENPVMGKPSTTNPFNGTHMREEKFEFAQKPQVKKDGDRWIITFATTAACDATVSILDEDGRVVRHLASGVLGKNAPYPFQQNSLSQKLEWDGLTTDFKKADAAGCKVRVSLGLTPEFERNLLYDPNELGGFTDSPGQKIGPGDRFITARGRDGTIYVIDGFNGGAPNGRAFGKDGRYLRTFFPPPAKECEKVMVQQGWKTATTTWGDRVIVGMQYGFLPGNCNRSVTEKSPPMDQYADAVAALKMQPGVEDVVIGTRPAVIPPGALHRIERKNQPAETVADAFLNRYCRLAVDRKREELYFGYIRNGIFRVSGKTGELDKSWFPDGSLLYVSECCFGPDDLLYLRVGVFGYGQWLIRLDHEGKPVPFGGEAVVLPGGTWTEGEPKYGPLAGQKMGGLSPRPPAMAKAGEIKAMWTGETHHSNTHTRGLYVSPNGMIVTSILFQSPSTRTDYVLGKGIPKETAPPPWEKRVFVVAMDVNGNYYTANAIGDTANGHNVFMDRDGNVYSGVGYLTDGDDRPYGIADTKVSTSWGGHASLVKFPWNGKFPLATLEYPDKRTTLKTREGSQWIVYHCLPGFAIGCTCFNNRHAMDYWARTWVGASHLGSLLAMDANGNVIGRFGRYGNIDDADPAFGKLHFGWIRAVTASDTAVYVDDQPNRRILKATMKYATEESVPVP